MDIYDKKLTVGELISILQQHHPSTLIFVNGYESGLETPTIIPGNVGPGQWGNCGGPWDLKEDGETALVLSREEEVPSVE
jgi:hypothetical protein